ncbi:Imm6 family immunity protein [Bacillus sp. NPDC094106]|uniref:Imm6 family immunity protein n=1 Tax=Bacillus sp. NPDC094106 TaxID=3363949 RepID=UPI0038120D5E
MLNRFKNLNADKQAGFLLGLSEIVIDVLSHSSGYEEAKETMIICWEWREYKQKSGDKIYYLLDDGTEFSGLFIRMEMDKGNLQEAVWNCIVDAVAYTDWQAYLHQKEKYLPSPIENVDEDLVQHFLDNFHEIKSINKELVEKFILYCEKIERVDKESTMKYLKSFL